MAAGRRVGPGGLLALRAEGLWDVWRGPLLDPLPQCPAAPGGSPLPHPRSGRRPSPVRLPADPRPAPAGRLAGEPQAGLPPLPGGGADAEAPEPKAAEGGRQPKGAGHADGSQ